MNRFLWLLLIISFQFANNFATIIEESTETSREDEVIQSPTNSYTILKKLGEGAFGEVFAVENAKGEKFAIKSYKPSFQTSDSKKTGSYEEESSINAWDLLADAEREFQRGQVLDHPHIIKSIELFTSSSSSNPTTYLVLQLVEGQTLYNTGKKSLSHQAAVHAALQLSDALRYALSFGLIHLDLHQNNIMLANGADMMVIDLASFFTFEEMFGYVQSQTEKKEEIASIKQIKANLKAPSIHPIQAKKMKRFFMNHPQLFNELKERGHDSNPSFNQAKFNKMAIVTGRAPHVSSNWLEAARLSFYAHYFNQVTDVCLSIISKSDGSKEDKLNKYAEIKKIAWNYLEDVEDGQSINIEESLDKLLEVLTSE
ncbi:protein kinase domain-containing protein [Candidatus Protochlamydia phocaeensis]|uniref:protein kinase domain-containing protein n=1 Tax=Candidatus Protochlamydia phocaeensis TaxID=1414722 RepID=UPI000838C07E|nr:protein kinase [Candidatus Protochlamydia phocaeensis]